MTTIGTGGVTCLGLTVLDVVQWIERPPVWGHKSRSSAAEVVVGGPAANAAICAAHLLGSANLVTGVGNGAAARLVRDELERYGVRVIDLAPPGWELPVAACLVDRQGERTVVSPGALATDWALSPEARQVVANSSVVLVDGHHPVAAGQGLQVARESGVGTVLDAGSAKAHTWSWHPLLDVVAGSVDYAEGLGTGTEATIEAVLAAGARSVVMTDGPGDIVWSTGEGRLQRCRPPQVVAVDSLGAGDAFHGALVAALAAGRELGEAVGFAAEVGSVRVSHRGARQWLSEVAPLS